MKKFEKKLQDAVKKGLDQSNPDVYQLVMQNQDELSFGFENESGLSPSLAKSAKLNQSQSHNRSKSTKRTNKKKASYRRGLISAISTFAAAIMLLVGLPILINSTLNTNVISYDTFRRASSFGEVDRFINSYYRQSWLSKQIQNFDNRDLANFLNPESDTESHSSTNVQVQGVDESDIIKTDGKYIYAASGGRLYIIDGATMDIVATFSNAPTSFIYEIYIVSIGGVKTAVLISNFATNENQARSEDIDAGFSSYGNAGVICLDLSDITNPTMLFSTVYDRSYLITSRIKDDVLYLVMGKSCFDYSQNSPIHPFYVENNQGKSTTKNLQASDIHFLPSTSYPTYFLTATIDLANPTDHEVKAYLGGVAQFYMSHNNLYVLTYSNSSLYAVRFAISEGKVAFAAFTSVFGSVLNQFSLSEYDGAFRIATTGIKNGKVVNGVYIYDALSLESMNLLGELTGLGKPNEQIYAVRFYGDTAYVVTFQQIDPLYKLDLSVKTNPRVLGELEIPGFSTYLHMLNNGYLLGIGKVSNYVKLSLFDISNDEPIEISSLTLTNVEYSEALYNHKAMVFYEGADGKEYFGFAAMAASFVQTPNYGGITYLSSYLIFTTSENGELILVDTITCELNDTYPLGASVLRAVFIGDNIFVMTQAGLYKYSVLDYSFIKACDFVWYNAD